MTPTSSRRIGDLAQHSVRSFRRHSNSRRRSNLPRTILGQVPFLAFYRQSQDPVAQILRNIMKVELRLSLIIHFFRSLDNIFTYKCCRVVLSVVRSWLLAGRSESYTL